MVWGITWVLVWFALLAAGQAHAQQSDKAEEMASFMAVKRDCPAEYAVASKLEPRFAALELAWAYIPDATKLVAEKAVREKTVQMYGNDIAKLCSVFKNLVASAYTTNKPTDDDRFPEGVTAKVTRIESASGGHFYPLIVVENKTGETYATTEWSCTFYDQAGEPVHEDRFWVKNVMANGKTASKSISSSRAQFVSSTCRPLFFR
jgi:hypothetical protein